jgi:hypothetical protein
VTRPPPDPRTETAPGRRRGEIPRPFG